MRDCDPQISMKRIPSAFRADDIDKAYQRSDAAARTCQNDRRHCSGLIEVAGKDVVRELKSEVELEPQPEHIGGLAGAIGTLLDRIAEVAM